MDLFHPDFVKEHLLEHFLEMSGDSVISVKILFIEVVKRLKQISMYDD